MIFSKSHIVACFIFIVLFTSCPDFKIVYNKNDFYSTQDCYICGSYKKRTRDCTTHSIRTDLLTAGVLANLRQVTEYAAKHESRFVKLLVQQEAHQKLVTRFIIAKVGVVKMTTPASFGKEWLHLF